MPAVRACGKHGPKMKANPYHVSRPENGAFFYGRFSAASTKSLGPQSKVRMYDISFEGWISDKNQGQFLDCILGARLRAHGSCCFRAPY